MFQNTFSTSIVLVAFKVSLMNDIPNQKILNLNN